MLVDVPGHRHLDVIVRGEQGIGPVGLLVVE